MQRLLAKATLTALVVLALIAVSVDVVAYSTLTCVKEWKRLTPVAACLEVDLASLARILRCEGQVARRK